MIEHETSGLLVEPRQPEKLAEAIGRLLKSPAEAQQMGHAARRRFLKHLRDGPHGPAGCWSFTIRLRCKSGEADGDRQPRAEGWRRVEAAIKGLAG